MGELDDEGKAMKSKVIVYCCKFCRQNLFRNDLLNQHAKNQQEFAYRRREKEKNVSLSSTTEVHKTACTSYFITSPMKWLNNQAKSTSGKILCPSCNKRLGIYSWKGSQCSCGSWIVPALQITKSKVDIRLKLKNSLPESIQPAY